MPGRSAAVLLLVAAVLFAGTNAGLLDPLTGSGSQKQQQSVLDRIKDAKPNLQDKFNAGATSTLQDKIKDAVADLQNQVSGTSATDLQDKLNAAASDLQDKLKGAAADLQDKIHKQQQGDQGGREQHGDRWNISSAIEGLNQTRSQWDRLNLTRPFRNINSTLSRVNSTLSRVNVTEVIGRINATLARLNRTHPADCGNWTDPAHGAAGTGNLTWVGVLDLLNRTLSNATNHSCWNLTDVFDRLNATRPPAWANATRWNATALIHRLNATRPPGGDSARGNVSWGSVLDLVNQTLSGRNNTITEWLHRRNRTRPCLNDTSRPQQRPPRNLLSEDVAPHNSNARGTGNGNGAGHASDAFNLLAAAMDVLNKTLLGGATTMINLTQDERPRNGSGDGNGNRRNGTNPDGGNRRNQTKPDGGSRRNATNPDGGRGNGNGNSKDRNNLAAQVVRRLDATISDLIIGTLQSARADLRHSAEALRVADTAASHLSQLLEWGPAAGEGAADLANKLSSLVDDATDSAGDSLRDALDSLSGLLGNASDVAGDGVAAAGGAAKSEADSLLSKLNDLVDASAVDSARDTATDLLDKLRHVLDSGRADAVAGAVKDAGSGVAGADKDAATSTTSDGKAMKGAADAAQDAITSSTPGSVKDAAAPGGAASDVVDTIEDTVTDAAAGTVKDAATTTAAASSAGGTAGDATDAAALGAVPTLLDQVQQALDDVDADGAAARDLVDQLREALMTNGADGTAGATGATGDAVKNVVAEQVKGLFGGWGRGGHQPPPSLPASRAPPQLTPPDGLDGRV